MPDEGSHYITELCEAIKDYAQYASLNAIMHDIFSEGICFVYQFVM